MAKIFYTERDIDDMKARGMTSIDVTDNVVLTDLALERAMRYEMKINRMAQSAPRAVFSQSVNLAVSTVHTVAKSADADLHQRIKSAVLAKLDGQVDGALLDAVITRVLNAMK